MVGRAVIKIFLNISQAVTQCWLAINVKSSIRLAQMRLIWSKTVLVWIVLEISNLPTDYELWKVKNALEFADMSRL